MTNALRQLRNMRGNFLIRPSSQGPGYWAIMVNVGNEQVKKFLIREARDKEGGWILAGRRFESISHIIDRLASYVFFNLSYSDIVIFPFLTMLNFVTPYLSNLSMMFIHIGLGKPLQPRTKQKLAKNIRKIEKY